MTTACLFRRRLWIVAAALVLFPVGLTGTAVAAEPGPAATPSWPQWHGAGRTNISSETGLLAVWPATGPRLLWIAAGCGKGCNSVTVADGRIYTAGDVDKQTLVTAFDLNGKRLWQAPNGTGWQAPADIEGVFRCSSIG